MVEAHAHGVGVPSWDIDQSSSALKDYWELINMDRVGDTPSLSLSPAPANCPGPQPSSGARVGDTEDIMDESADAVAYVGNLAADLFAVTTPPVTACRHSSFLAASSPSELSDNASQRQFKPFLSQAHASHSDSSYSHQRLQQSVHIEPPSAAYSNGSARSAFRNDNLINALEVAHCEQRQPPLATAESLVSSVTTSADAPAATDAAASIAAVAEANPPIGSGASGSSTPPQRPQRYQTYSPTQPASGPAPPHWHRSPHQRTWPAANYVHPSAAWYVLPPFAAEYDGGRLPVRAAPPHLTTSATAPAAGASTAAGPAAAEYDGFSRQAEGAELGNCEDGHHFVVQPQQPLCSWAGPSGLPPPDAFSMPFGVLPAQAASTAGPAAADSAGGTAAPPFMWAPPPLPPPPSSVVNPNGAAAKPAQQRAASYAPPYPPPPPHPHHLHAHPHFARMRPPPRRYVWVDGSGYPMAPPPPLAYLPYSRWPVAYHHAVPPPYCRTGAAGGSAAAAFWHHPAHHHHGVSAPQPAAAAADANVSGGDVVGGNAANATAANAAAGRYSHHDYLAAFAVHGVEDQAIAADDDVGAGAAAAPKRRPLKRASSAGSLAQRDLPPYYWQGSAAAHPQMQQQQLSLPQPQQSCQHPQQQSQRPERLYDCWASEDMEEVEAEGVDGGAPPLAMLAGPFMQQQQLQPQPLLPLLPPLRGQLEQQQDGFKRRRLLVGSSSLPQPLPSSSSLPLVQQLSLPQPQLTAGNVFSYHHHHHHHHATGAEGGYMQNGHMHGGASAAMVMASDPLAPATPSGGAATAIAGSGSSCSGSCSDFGLAATAFHGTGCGAASPCVPSSGGDAVAAVAGTAAAPAELDSQAVMQIDAALDDFITQLAVEELDVCLEEGEGEGAHAAGPVPARTALSAPVAAAAAASPLQRQGGSMPGYDSGDAGMLKSQLQQQQQQTAVVATTATAAADAAAAVAALPFPWSMDLPPACTAPFEPSAVHLPLEGGEARHHPAQLAAEAPEMTMPLPSRASPAPSLPHSESHSPSQSQSPPPPPKGRRPAGPASRLRGGAAAAAPRRVNGNSSRCVRTSLPATQAELLRRLPATIRVTVTGEVAALATAALTHSGGVRRSARRGRSDCGSDVDVDDDADRSPVDEDSEEAAERVSAAVSKGGGVLGVFHVRPYLEGRKCIEHGGELVSRSAFERLGGSMMAKWYRSIKVVPGGLSLGKWLTSNGLPILKGSPRRSRKGQAAAEDDADAE